MKTCIAGFLSNNINLSQTKMHFQTSLLTTAVFAALAVSQQIEVIAPDDQCYLQAGTSSGDTIYGCYGVSEPFAPNNDGDCSG